MKHLGKIIESLVLLERVCWIISTSLKEGRNFKTFSKREQELAGKNQISVMKLHIINIQSHPHSPVCPCHYYFQHTLGVESVHRDGHRWANQWCLNASSQLQLSLASLCVKQGIVRTLLIQSLVFLPMFSNGQHNRTHPTTLLVQGDMPTEVTFGISCILTRGVLASLSASNV